MIGYWRRKFILKLLPFWIINEELQEHEIQSNKNIGITYLFQLMFWIFLLLKFFIHISKRPSWLREFLITYFFYSRPLCAVLEYYIFHIEHFCNSTYIQVYLKSKWFSGFKKKKKYICGQWGRNWGEPEWCHSPKCLDCTYIFS